MSLVVVHLRWNDVDPEQYDELVLTVPGDGGLPAGCLSRQLRREANAVLATEVWDDEVAASRMDDLVIAVRAVGVRQSPQLAMLTVPAGYAVAYRNPSPMPAIPRQPGPPVQEQLPAASHEPRTATVRPRPRSTPGGDDVSEKSTAVPTPAREDRAPQRTAQTVPAPRRSPEDADDGSTTREAVRTGAADHGYAPARYALERLTALRSTD